MRDLCLHVLTIQHEEELHLFIGQAFPLILLMSFAWHSKPWYHLTSQMRTLMRITSKYKYTWIGQSSCTEVVDNSWWKRLAVAGRHIYRSYQNLHHPKQKYVIIKVIECFNVFFIRASKLFIIDKINNRGGNVRT